MSLKKLAIIVDGPTEEGSLRLKFQMSCYDCPNIRIGPGNGITYSVEGYAKGVLPTLIYLLNSSIRAIILIPDLEKRKIKPETFSINLKMAIVTLLIQETKFEGNYLNDVIHVCPPNIMFENWIISDVESIKANSSLIKQNSVQKEFEGKNGASELQIMMTTKYKKTVHAKQLFKYTDDITNATNSLSYNKYLEILNQLREKHCQ